MLMKSDRRSRKRLATRQAISDAATRLFFEHGFDRVTVDEIAEAADVGRMTVFNHFPRKEDMFFDREQELHDLAFAAIRDRESGTSPIVALGKLAHDLVENPNPPLPLFDYTQRFVETALASETLKARARQMRDNFVKALAAVLAGDREQAQGDPLAHLAAALIASTWSVAFSRGHDEYDRTGDVREARRVFLGLIDRGTAGTIAALDGSVYG